MTDRSSTPDRSTARLVSRVAAALGAAALTVALAACGSSSGDAPSGPTGGTGRSASSASSSSASSAVPPAGDHDSADVTFAQQMIVHHQGAIAMADLAADRAGDQRVKDLAARIRAAQAPEIEQMTGWLAAWDEPAPEASSDSSSGSTDHGGTADGAMGMMTPQQMSELSAASGTAFDRVFLQMMVVHHRGAVEMAQREQDAGASSEAVALASSIAASQSAEVAQMQQLLSDLG